MVNGMHQNSILLDNQPDSRYINACVEMTYGIPQDLDALLEKHREAVLLARKEAWTKDKEGSG